MTWREVFWATVVPKCNGLWSSDLCWTKVEWHWFQWWAFMEIGFGVTELWKVDKRENRLHFLSPYLPVRLCYCDRTCTKMKPSAYFVNRVMFVDKIFKEILKCFWAINFTVTRDNWNIIYLSLATGDPKTSIFLLNLGNPGVYLGVYPRWCL